MEWCHLIPSLTPFADAKTIQRLIFFHQFLFRGDTNAPTTQAIDDSVVHMAALKGLQPAGNSKTTICPGWFSGAIGVAQLDFSSNAMNPWAPHFSASP